MQIGEVARSVALEKSAMRCYEAHGIVPQPQRTEAGYPDYHADDVELLRFVRRCSAPSSYPSNRLWSPVKKRRCTTPDTRRPTRFF